jgi:hypothetical protein
MKRSRFETLARRLVLVLGLGAAAAGCGDGDAPMAPAGTPPAAVSGEPVAPAAPPGEPTLPELQVVAEADLARLRALDVVDVGGLVLDFPAEAVACYGPCPGFEAIVGDAYRRQAPRLAHLTDLIEEETRRPTAAAPEPDVTAADLEALRSLAIVDVRGLVRARPVTTTPCDGACEEAVARAVGEKARRAGVLHRTVATARARGL